MSSVGSHIAKVRKLFFDWADEVSRLALRDEGFRSMCHDYGLAVETLDVLERRNHPFDVEKMYEYRAFIKELERDLKYELLASNNNTADAR